MLEARLSTARHLSLYIPQSFQSQRFRRQSVDYKYRDIFLVFFIIITFILFLLLYIWPNLRLKRFSMRKSRTRVSTNYRCGKTGQKKQPRCTHSTAKGRREGGGQALPATSWCFINNKGEIRSLPHPVFWGQTTRASS